MTFTGVRFKVEGANIKQAEEMMSLRNQSLSGLSFRDKVRSSDTRRRVAAPSHRVWPVEEVP